MDKVWGVLAAAIGIAGILLVTIYLPNFLSKIIALLSATQVNKERIFFPRRIDCQVFLNSGFNPLMFQNDINAWLHNNPDIRIVHSSSSSALQPASYDKDNPIRIHTVTIIWYSKKEWGG